MRKWIVGNWKMNGSREHVREFIPELLRGLAEGFDPNAARVVVCPPHPYLTQVGQLLEGAPVELGAQKVHPLSSGAFTGEVSPAMLVDLGVRVCIVGHSEHRQHFGVTDAFIAEKLHALTGEGVDPILCVGETLREREDGRQEEVIRSQLLEAFKETTNEKVGRRQGDLVHVQHPSFSEETARGIAIAYEPVWAIGTGRTASIDQVGAMHRHIRAVLAERYSNELAPSLPILYGGSVTPDNAGELMRQPDVDGVLVGGASLKTDSFLFIINQALA